LPDIDISRLSAEPELGIVSMVVAFIPANATNDLWFCPTIGRYSREGLVWRLRASKS
jgi:hypothetical protein